MRNLNFTIQQSINRFSSAREKAESVYANLGETVVEEVNSLSLRLVSSECQDGAKILKPELLQQYTGSFSEQRISLEFQQAEDTFQQIMVQWIDSIKTDVAGTIEFLNKVNITGDAGGVKKKILIIEDDEIYSEILKSLLESVGYDVACEYNGDNEFNRIAELQPGHALLDYNLPDMTGLDMLKKVNSSNLLQRIPLSC